MIDNEVNDITKIIICDGLQLWNKKLCIALNFLPDNKPMKGRLFMN